MPPLLPPVDADGAELAATGVGLLAEGSPAAALPWLRAALQTGSASPSTQLNLAVAEQQAGDPLAALAMLQAVAQAHPGWDEPPLRLAEYWRQRGDPAQAEAWYETTLRCQPDRPEALLSLATLLLGRGDPARAQALLRHCCSVDPRSWQGWDALSVALRASGDWQDAYAASARAHALAPGDVGVALRLAEAALSRSEPCAQEALEAFAEDSLEDPLNAAALAGSAALLAGLGRMDESLDLLEAAVALAPQDALLAETHADYLLRARSNNAAAAAMQRALALNPGSPTLRNNYAAALTRIHRHVEAKAELETLLQTQGEAAKILCNLVTVETCLGETEAALHHARRAVELSPTVIGGYRSLSYAQCYADGVTGQDVLDTVRRAGQVIARGRLSPFRARQRGDPQKRLRVGLLSLDLRLHPVGFLTLAAFENLDPGAFELVALSEPLGTDILQRRFHSICAEWHVLDPEPASQIRALDLDVLIDLGGYGERGLMQHCAERLAPVQIKWVGMQNHSSGLPEMDWFISDRWETPPGHEHLYSERLLVMPDGYVCYTPPPDAPDVGALPALSRGHVTFGCFNNYAKITPRVIATWCAILHAVPDARLVLKALQLNHADTMAHAMARFAAHGIGPDRVEVRGGSGHRALMQQYNDIDLVLDPFPYSGGLTTCEALWMGVPVLTMPGSTFASRHSTSHVSNVGLSDWVVPDLDAYRAEAVRRAADVPSLAALRTALRPRMKASPLCDGPRFGRNLGVALRHTWHDWCERAPAQARAA